MSILERVKTISGSIQATTDAVGKTVWILIVGFVGIAIATGHPSLLGAIRARLIQAGFTTINTPVGVMDPAKIGMTSEILGINAARAADLAASAQDPAAKAQLDAIAKDLSKQQQSKVEELSAITASQRLSNREVAASARTTIQRWIYVGRYSSGKWLPPSFSIAEPAYPISFGHNIVIKSDAILYTGIDCQRADFSGQSGQEKELRAASFVKAGPEGVPSTGKVLECDSVGGAKTVWAEINIPSDRFIEFR